MHAQLIKTIILGPISARSKYRNRVLLLELMGPILAADAWPKVLVASQRDSIHHGADLRSLW